MGTSKSYYRVLDLHRDHIVSGLDQVQSRSSKLHVSVVMVQGYGTLLQWRHNGGDSVLDHQPHHCLLNHLFKRRSKKTSKLRITGLCAGNSPRTGEFPTQMASNAGSFSIWWRHHVLATILQFSMWYLFQTKYVGCEYVAISVMLLILTIFWPILTARWRLTNSVNCIDDGFFIHNVYLAMITGGIYHKAFNTYVNSSTSTQIRWPILHMCLTLSLYQYDTKQW